MSVEDTFKGAKNGLTFIVAYLDAVGKQIGTERALALDAEICETVGSEHGKMIKGQAGIEEFDAKAAHPLLLNAIKENFGVLSDVIEETPQKVVFKIGRCPLYEAAASLGMDAESIEASCRNGSIRFLDAMAKQLNPRLTYELRKFRPAADGHCEETIELV